jgi:hypothetical protein
MIDYSHGEYRHCAPALMSLLSMSLLTISARAGGTGSAASAGREGGTGSAASAGRGEGTGAAASAGRGECTGATALSLQQRSRI